MRSGSWKLHLANTNTAPGRNARNAAPAGQAQLYKLDSDLGESTNVADAYPEVVSRLHALADAMKDDLGLNGIGPGVRPLGRVSNPQPLIGKDGGIREGFDPTK